jgi:hypothetical protein
MPKVKQNTITPNELLLKEDFKSSNLFIYILIVAEVERFRSTAGSLLALQTYRPLSC